MDFKALPRNLLLTGLPRGGTTLTCFLLNQLPAVVALAEPMDVNAFVPDDEHANVRMIASFIAAQRETLLAEGRAVGKSVDGRAIDNPLSDERDAVTGARIRRINQSFIEVTKPLDSMFTLAIKHPSAFSAMLPTLRHHFECFATVRNPLAVLMSWAQTPFAVAKGHVPAAERLDAELTDRLAREDDVHERQITLLSWFFERYRHLPAGHVIKYEDIVATRGRVLPDSLALTGTLDTSLETRNDRHLSDPTCRRLADKLIARGGAYLDHYSATDISAMLPRVS